MLGVAVVLGIGEAACLQIRQNVERSDRWGIDGLARGDVGQHVPVEHNLLQEAQ